MLYYDALPLMCALCIQNKISEAIPGKAKKTSNHELLELIAQRLALNIVNKETVQHILVTLKQALDNKEHDVCLSLLSFLEVRHQCLALLTMVIICCNSNYCTL